MKDVIGKEYLEGHVYDMINVDYSVAARGEGDSEKNLRELFLMGKKSGKGEGHDGVVIPSFPDVGPVPVEIKDFTKINGRVRCEARGRENANRIFFELMLLCRIAKKHTTEAGAKKIEYLEKDIIRGNFRPGRINKLPELVADICANCEDVKKILESVSSPFVHGLPYRSAQKLIEELEPSRSFVVPDVIIAVVNRSHFVFASKENFDKLLKREGIASGFINYSLTETVRNGIVEHKAHGKLERTVFPG